MSALFRFLSMAAFLSVGVALLTGTTKAADAVGESPSNAKALPQTTYAVRWRERNWRSSGRHERWAAPSELVAGTRGTSPLTVPFFGSNWYPGPVYYYGPRVGSCMCRSGDARLSLRY
jgi:hypothetical protein